jgi:hypothetical protein
LRGNARLPVLHAFFLADYSHLAAAQKKIRRKSRILSFLSLGFSSFSLFGSLQVSLRKSG